MNISRKAFQRAEGILSNLAAELHTRAHKIDEPYEDDILSGTVDVDERDIYRFRRQRGVNLG